MAENKGRRPGRKPKPGPRYANGRRKPDVPSDPRAENSFRRAFDFSAELGLDARLFSPVGRLRWLGIFTDQHVYGADYIGRTYGRYERINGLKRAARSPSYELGARGAGGFDPEDAAAARDAFKALSTFLQEFSPRARGVIEELCVQGQPVRPDYYNDVKVVLKRVAKGEGRPDRTGSTQQVTVACVTHRPTAPPPRRASAEDIAIEAVCMLRPDLRDQAADIAAAIVERRRFRAQKHRAAAPSQQDAAAAGTGEAAKAAPAGRELPRGAPQHHLRCPTGLGSALLYQCRRYSGHGLEHMMPNRIFTPGEKLMVDVTVLPEEPQVVPIKPRVLPIDLHPRVARMIAVEVGKGNFITTFWVPVSEVADKGAGDGSATLRATVALDRDAFGDLIPIKIRGMNERLVVPRACVTQDAAAIAVREAALTAEELEHERVELRRLIEKHGLPTAAQGTCPHTRRSGAGGVANDGSGYHEWTCGDCGEVRREEWGPGGETAR